MYCGTPSSKGSEQQVRYVADLEKKTDEWAALA